MVHATAALVAAFFVFFAAERAHRILRWMGLLLGFWLIAVAIAEAFRGPPMPPVRLPQLSVPPHAPASAR